MNSIRLVILALCLSACPSLYAQNDATFKRFTQLFNEEEFDSIYDMLDESYQATTTAASFTSFLEDKIFSALGKIKRSTLLSETKGTYVYLITFQAGELDFIFNTNDKAKITGLLFQPHKQVPASKNPTRTLISGNKLLTPTDRLVDSIVKKYTTGTERVGLSIGIITNQQKYTYHYGEKEKNSGILPDDFTLFEIGSVSKTFTTWLFSDALEKKLVRADDDIRKYLTEDYPNLAYKNQCITLMQLANHTSGLPRIPENLDQQENFNPLDPYSNYDTLMLFNYLKHVELNQTPGSKMDYSNLSMALLGIILEKVYAKPYYVLIKEVITDPSKMQHTFVVIPSENMATRATVYNENGEETPHWNMGRLAPAGGIYSCLDDMLTYMKVNSAQKSKTLKRQHTTTFTSDARSSVALGWFSQKGPGQHNIIWHNGATYGSASFCAFIPETKTVIVLLSNSGINCDELAMALIKSF